MPGSVPARHEPGQREGAGAFVGRISARGTPAAPSPLPPYPAMHRARPLLPLGDQMNSCLILLVTRLCRD